MTVQWAPKSPDEVVYRSIMWIGPLNGGIIATSALAVLDDSSTIALTNVANTNTEVTCTVSGGLLGELAVIQNTITTLDGRTLVQIITMGIADPQAVLVPTSPSSTTKQIAVNMAFEEMTLAGYEFDQTPEEQFSLLRRLDAIMGEWKMAGLDLGYNFPNVFGQGNLTDAIGVPDETMNAVILELALRGASAIGKTLSPETMRAYAAAMIALRTAYAALPQRRLDPNTAIGSGNKPWSTWQPFGWQTGAPSRPGPGQVGVFDQSTWDDGDVWG